MSLAGDSVFANKSVDDLRLICKTLEVTCRGNRAEIIARLRQFTPGAVQVAWCRSAAAATYASRCESEQQAKDDRARRLTLEELRESEQQAKDDRARRPTLEELRSSIIPKGEKRRRTTPDRYSPCSRPSDDDDDSWQDISLDGESESGAMDDDEVVVISDAGE
ncbi:unnamed protein product [Durusdinium trenchii]|uniref:SAP domain-containing protein n=2 Tax=Durusdinium trenchii TaxID=1381693 RepID=A0ABP0MU48_9DINO